MSTAARLLDAEGRALLPAELCWRCDLRTSTGGPAAHEPLDRGPSRRRARASLADALKSMRRANSGLTWIRQKHVTEFLQQPRDDTNRDARPRSTPCLKSRTREDAPGPLTEHGVLPLLKMFYRASLRPVGPLKALERVSKPPRSRRHTPLHPLAALPPDEPDGSSRHRARFCGASRPSPSRSNF